MTKAIIVPLAENCVEAKKLLEAAKGGKGDFNIEERDDHVLVRNVCADIKIKNSNEHLPVSITKQFFKGEIFLANGLAFQIK